MSFAIHRLLRVYIYGGIASTVCITLTLISTVIICPVLANAHGKSTLSFLVALAVGCMTGDAIFHLLPHVFLTESADGDTGGSNITAYRSESGSAHEMIVVWRALPIASTIYTFYFFHILSESLQNTGDHCHSHLSMSKKETVNPDNDITDGETINQSAENIADKSDSKIASNQSKKLPVVIWMIVIGDVIHSFSDGVAIGGAYAKSFYGGLGTTVAIVFHEIPHGVGDFAVMVTTGLTQTRSFVLLTIVLSPMYLGMVLGATLGQLMDLTRLIFAITSGMFLFVSLTEMLPRILALKSREKHKWKLPFLHSCGIFLGMLTMFCIAVLEGKLNS